MILLVEVCSRIVMAHDSMHQRGITLSLLLLRSELAVCTQTDCLGDRYSRLTKTLHQVKGRVPSAQVQQAAKTLSNGNAILALELVGYDQNLKAAMQYAFGGSYVCKVRPQFLAAAEGMLDLERVHLACLCIVSALAHLRSILQDTSTAKALAFHKEVRTRCITLEGDDFNPGGTLTGQKHQPSFPFVPQFMCSC